MKSAKFLNLMVLGLVLTIPLVGCKKNPRGITPLPGARVSPPRDLPPGQPMDPNRPVDEGDVGWKPVRPEEFANWPQDREIFKSQTIYFDFDSSVVKGSERSKADAVASHLTANPSHALKVEGHCDERGTEEYNRVLGERRALAVREQLIAAGIAPDRILTISFGEDRPADPGHNETAWRLNRRGEFILLTPK